MRYTFKPDDCMVITIPLGSLQNAVEGQLMPEKFTCRFKDMYKVFLRGRPKAIGAAQLVTAVFILILGGIILNKQFSEHAIYIIPSTMFIPCGILTFTAGQTPFMPVMKLSFIFNILSLITGVAGAVVCIVCYSYHLRYPWFYRSQESVHLGLTAVIASLYALEFLLAAIITFWESKAVCRSHFNSLPMITLKQDM